jgi:hypothetical protein
MKSGMGDIPKVAPGRLGIMDDGFFAWWNKGNEVCVMAVVLLEDKVDLGGMTDDVSGWEEI